MRKPTQPQIIKQYLQDVNDWVESYRLRGVATKYGFIGHQGDRRARELAHPKWLLQKFPEKKHCTGCGDGEIEHNGEGKYARYRAKQFTQKIYAYAVDNNGMKIPLYEKVYAN